MNAPETRHSSAAVVDPRSDRNLSRRRLLVLLAVGAGTLAALASCGGDEELHPGGGYKFPGAKKDDTGNYRMRNI